MQTQSGKGNDGANTRLIKRFSLNGEYISNGAASAVFHDDPDFLISDETFFVGCDVFVLRHLRKDMKFRSEFSIKFIVFRKKRAEKNESDKVEK